MSSRVNDLLFERAREVRVYFEGTVLEKAITNNIRNGDLEMVEHLVKEGEAEMSRQEFYNNDMMSERDEY